MNGIEFLNRIDLVCKDLNITRSSVGDAVGISKGTMASWKTKNIIPIADSAYSIAYVLGVSSDWLINGSNFSEVEESHIIKQREEIRNNIYKLASNLRKPHIVWEKTLKDGLEADYEACHTEIITNIIPSITYRRLYNWAKCRFEINYQLLELLAKGLKVTVGELLLKNDTSLNSDSLDKNLYEKAISHKETLLMLDSLTPENREKIESILKDTYKLQNLESANK